MGCGCRLILPALPQITINTRAKKMVAEWGQSPPTQNFEISHPAGDER
jgi:hypothetical protein